MENIRWASEFNFYIQQMELGTMLPLGFMGRVPVPKPPFQGDTFTLNHINVDRSTIGAINTGSIRSLDVAITRMESQGDSEIGQALAELTQKVIDTSDLSELDKNELLEYLSFLAEQSILPKQQRTQSITRAVANAIDGLIQGVPPSLKQTWERFKFVLTKN